MAFGKVTVASENGEYEEHELERPTTSLGRQPGNDIVLNSSAVSRYHAQFDVYGGQVFLVDLGTVNGTFVNDQQVEPNSRSALKDGDIVMLGDVRLIFNASQTRPLGTVMLSLNPRVHEKPGVPIRLTLDDPNQPVAPGGFLQLALIIENRTGVERLFTIHTEGLQPNWLKINRREVRLDHGEQTEVMLSVRPPRLSDTRPSTYPLSIRVAYKDDPEQFVEAQREIEVLGFTGLAMAIRQGRGGQYSLAVQNQGNYPLEIHLKGYQRASALAYEFEPDHMWINPGDTAQIRLRVRAVRETPGIVPFAVIASSTDKAAFQAPLAAVFRRGGAPSAGGPSRAAVAAGLGIPALLLIGLLLAIVAVAGLWALGYLPLPTAFPSMSPATAEPVMITATPLPPTVTPQPTAIPTPAIQLKSFAAQPAEFTFGTIERVIFTWQIEGVTEVTDYVLYEPDEGQQLALPAAAWSIGQLEVTPGALAIAFGWDESAYTLKVTGSDGEPRSISATVTITPVKCELVAGTIITEAPPVAGGPPPNPVAGPTPREVVLGGRTPDNAALYVWSFADHAPLGWVPVARALCPPVPTLDNFIVIEP